MAKYECTICGYVYDDEAEDKPFTELDEDYVCPICGVDQTYFKREK